MIKPIDFPNTLIDVASRARPNTARLDMKGRDKKPRAKPVVVTSKNIEWLDKKAHPDQLIRAFKVVAPTLEPHLKSARRAQGGRFALIQHNAYGLNNTLEQAYMIGGTFFVTDASTCEDQHCGAGLNVGTQDWTMRCLGRETSHVCCHDLLMEVEFRRKDVAVFPVRINSETTWPCRKDAVGITKYRKERHGKFRCHSFRVISARALTEKEVTRMNGPRPPAVVHVPSKAGWRKTQAKARAD